MLGAELRLIAEAANMGERGTPKKGKSPPAAIGTLAELQAKAKERF